MSNDENLRELDDEVAAEAIQSALGGTLDRSGAATLRSISDADLWVLGDAVADLATAITDERDRRKSGK